MITSIFLVSLVVGILWGVAAYHVRAEQKRRAADRALAERLIKRARTIYSYPDDRFNGA